jgi:hypothetical protein
MDNKYKIETPITETPRELIEKTNRDGMRELRAVWEKALRDKSSLEAEREETLTRKWDHEWDHGGE